MKTYNKLVRHKIPFLIADQGKVCDIKILTDAEYMDALNAKLDEEVAEYHESGSIEELADILEVIYAISLAKKCTIGALEEIRRKKAEERGHFRNKIMLLSVQED